VAQEFSDETSGTLSIATTHTQARYVLPPIIKDFMSGYPNVSLQMQQGTPPQIAEMAAEGSVDFAIATEALQQFNSLVLLPCYRWTRCIVVPKGHPLTQVERLTLEAVAEHPIVTYTFGFTGRSKLDDAFKSRGLVPHVVFTAVDSDVIKTYVRLGLGIGIIAGLAHDEDLDEDLVKLNVDHLFASSVTSLAFRKGSFLRGYMYDFIQALAPHLTRDIVVEALSRSNPAEREALYSHIELPTY
jgi:LysR family cys regulon transcriptional activator